MQKAEKTVVVTIDGPSASGKSSVSRELARRLGWEWLSTGAFYRGLAFVARAKGLPLADSLALTKLASSNEWQIKMADARTQVWHGINDVTDQIYSEQIAGDASLISQIPKVRESLLQAQRDCQNGRKGLVAEGRDCGTVIFPTALLKIYLTARSDQRAQRRAQEEGRSIEDTKAAQTQRDRQDSTRKTAPLQVPTDGIVLDTSDMGIDQVVEQIYQLIAQKLRNTDR